MSERSELLREADEAYAALRQAIEGLSEEEMQRAWLGTWGVREIAIHIAGWHREMIPALARIGRGEPPYPDGVSYDDADAWNARFVTARQGVKAADALVELDASHRAYVAAAGALPGVHLAPGGAARDLFDGCGPGHYREHAAQIARWRQSLGPERARTAPRVA